jgi:hypothetical protein
MRILYLALYGGPDQIMGVTSGLAGLLGLLLIFWNKVVTTFFKIIRKLRGSPEPAAGESQNSVPGQTS